MLELCIGLANIAQVNGWLMQGVPVVQAPGEGEALCAALNQQGLVHGCATLDGDVLLFGAHTVYHTLKLQVGLAVLTLKLQLMLFTAISSRERFRFCWLGVDAPVPKVQLQQ